jgi:hypothetical protein
VGKHPQPGFYRFKLGDIEITVVGDGTLAFEARYRGDETSMLPAAPAWERSSAVLADIASLSKSSNFGICNPATMAFRNLYSGTTPPATYRAQLIPRYQRTDPTQDRRKPTWNIELRRTQLDLTQGSRLNRNIDAGSRPQTELSTDKSVMNR